MWSTSPALLGQVWDGQAQTFQVQLKQLVYSLYGPQRRALQISSLDARVLDYVFGTGWDMFTARQQSVGCMCSHSMVVLQWRC